MRKSLISMVISGKDPARIMMDTATPRNSTGLCNQIFHFINTLYVVKQSGTDYQIVFDHFSRDIIGGEHIGCSEIFDLAKMNDSNGWDIKEIEEYRGGHAELFAIGYVFLAKHQDPHFFSETAKKLQFNQKYEVVARNLIREKGLDGQEVNLVHLRIDEDCRRHLLGSVGQERLDAYIDSYREKISENCDTGKKLVLLLEETDHELVKELQQKYETVFLTKEEVTKVFREANGEEISGRELFALVDLLFGKNLNAENFIYAENETFTSSFGVLLKEIGHHKSAMSV